jgi:AcrR family transcriptional regulator
MKQGSKPAVQERSRQTRDRIVDALERLLRKRDFGDLSVADLAEEAEVSPGAIYRRFEGGLLPVLFELYRVTLERRVRAPAADIDVAAAGELRAALRAAARAMSAQLSEHAHVYRAVYLYARLRPDVPSEAPSQVEALALSGVRDLLKAFRTEVKRGDLERATATVAYFFNPSFLERVLFPERTPKWPKLVTKDAFAVEMAELAYGYLTARDP